MKKIILLSIALILAGFLSAPAQNNVTIPEQLQKQNASLEYPDFKNPKLSAPKESKSGKDWWEPDTICVIYLYSNDPGDRRFIRTYNLQGLLEKNLEQRGKNNLYWGNYTLDTYTYDSNNNLLTHLNQMWDNNSWGNDGLSTYTNTYDSNNNLLTVLVQNRENDSWINSNQTIRTYDSNNNMLTYLRQNWANNSWVNNDQVSYIYDSNNNLLSQLSQIWANNSWENSSLDTYTYDSNNNILTYKQQIWANNSWAIDYQVSYTYDSNNNLLSELQQRPRTPNLWKYLMTYTYDSSNNRLTELQQAWHEDSESWVSFYLITYTYDSNNNRLTDLRQQLWPGDSWKNDVQYLMTYDENGNETSVEFWWWLGESWQPGNDLPISLTLYYNNRQSYFQLWACHKMTASYIKVSDRTSIEKPPATPELNAISIYPNPTKGELTIDNGELKIESVRIYDVFGKQLSTFNFQFSTNPVDVSHLPAGTYFVQIKTEKGIVTKKIVKL